MNYVKCAAPCKVVQYLLCIYGPQDAPTTTDQLIFLFTLYLLTLHTVDYRTRCVAECIKHTPGRMQAGYAHLYRPVVL